MSGGTPQYPQYPRYPSPVLYPRQPEPPRRPPLDKFAVAALILSLIPLGITWLIAIGLAIPAIVRTRRGQTTGGEFAITGLVLSLVFSVFGVLLLIAAPHLDFERKQSDWAYNGLAIGACFGDGSVSMYDIELYDDPEEIPCEEEHQYEVFAKHEVGGEFPGETRLMELADEICAEAFEPYVGETLEESALDYGFTHPSRATWRQGDRTVVCIVHAMDEPLITGSVRGGGGRTSLTT